MKPILIKKCIPFDYFQIDFIGSLDVPFRDRYVLVAVDKSTNYCVIEKTASPTAEVVIKLVKRIIKNFNNPTKITCDNGKHFDNKAFKKFCEEEKIQLIYSTTYSPQSQGLVERMNGIIKKGLNKYSAKTNEEWKDLLEGIVSTYNSTPIEHFGNLTPFYLVHGYNKTSILEKELGVQNHVSREEELKEVRKKREEIPSLVKKQAEKNKTQYDKNKRVHIFMRNELVLVRQPKNVAKSKFNLDGPFRVKKKLTDLTYLIKISPLKDEKIHVRRLIPYVEDGRYQNQLPPLIQDSEM